MTQRAPGATAVAFDRAAYDARAEAFSAETTEERYLHYSGQKDDLALEPIYARHTALFGQESIQGLEDLIGQPETDAVRQARLLLQFAIDGHLERGAAEFTEEVAAAEARTTLTWQGQRIGYRAASVLIADLPERAERNALDAVYQDAVEEINPIREERLVRLHENATRFGDVDYAALYSRIKGIAFDSLAISLQEFLAMSETVYFAALRRYLARIDIEQGDASRADLAHVLRGQAFDPWFRADRLLPILNATLAGLGIDASAQSNVTLDLERRPNKVPRAFCAPVRVPDDVRLVVLPRGGHDDYLSVLHEAGHVQHFAHAPGELPVAYRRFGDNSVTEAFAFLFEYLMLEPAWLADHLGVRESETAVFLDFASFRKLYYLRRYVAKLLYEVRLHHGMDTAVARAYYAGVLSFLVGVRYPESGFLADLDDGLYSGQYIRAWLLEACISAALRERYGAAWWREPAAGDFLRQLWARGQRSTADEVAVELGYDKLDWRPVLRHIRTHLIGEMSGYGGPNITTRAGTRKV